MDGPAIVNVTSDTGTTLARQSRTGAITHYQPNVPHGGGGSMVLDLCGVLTLVTLRQARELHDELALWVTRPESRTTFGKMPGTGDEVWREVLQANSHDPYSRGVIDFAERWAVVMERRMGAVIGCTVADCADDARREAYDDLHPTGFVYDVAASILIECWVHGEALRRWLGGRPTSRVRGPFTP